LAVSPFDGASRIRFKGSPNGLSVPIEIGTPPKRIWLSNERIVELRSGVRNQTDLINTSLQRGG